MRFGLGFDQSEIPPRRRDTIGTRAVMGGRAQRVRIWHTVWIGLILACASLPARPSYVEAVEAYGAGDLVTAQREFAVMARLGHRTSQYNLAVMLLKGEGGQEQPTEAFAWFSVAAEAGDESAQRALTTMSPRAIDKDRERAAEIRSQYGIEANLERLLQLTNQFEPLEIKWTRWPALQYPYMARKLSREGWVVAEAQFGPHGEPKDPRIVFAENEADFTVPTIFGIQNGRRKDKAGGGRPPLYGVIPVQFQGYRTSATYAVDLTHLEALCGEAEIGNPRTEVLCGLVTAYQKGNSPEKRETGYRTIIRATLAGQPDAALLVGAALASIDEEPRRTEGLKWWEVAAQNGSNAARARVVDSWLRARPVSEATLVRVKRWMERIVAGDDDWAIKHVAAIWATHPDARVRDPSKAIALLPRLEYRGRVDPQIFEIEAAARAIAGDKSRAIWAQDMAIKGAKLVDWDTGQMEERRERYKKGGAWFGDLILGTEEEPGLP